MSNEPLANAPTQSRSWLADRKSTWALPMVVGGLLAVAYACTMTRLWDASQAVAVRQDASASSDRPGKFADLYEMRTVQETILELARSQQVIAATLQNVDGETANPPSTKAVDQFRERLRMSPPGGAEFGKTEVFYLSVKDPDRQRALQLVAQLCQQLDLRLRELRSDQARGLIIETKAQLKAAEQLLSAETERLADFEAQVGADLGELRTLNSSWSGQSDLRQKYVALEADCRRFQEDVRETKQLLDLLSSADVDAAHLAALPSSLLSAQPALRQLKDGLVDAQLRTARMQGVRSEAHPRVQAAIEAEARMRRDLAEEMEIARHAAEAELRLRESRYEAARAQLTAVQRRLAELAEKRAEYSNRISALESSRAAVDRLRQRLAASRATQAAAQESSVLTPVDQPETGPSPAGPSRAMIVLAGLAGGLVIGVGWVVCQLPISNDAVAGQTVPADSAAGALSEASTPEWWEIPSAASASQMPAMPSTRQAIPTKSFDTESIAAQPDDSVDEDDQVDVAKANPSPTVDAREAVERPDDHEKHPATPAAEGFRTTVTDEPAGAESQALNRNEMLFEEASEPTVDNDAGATAIATEDDEPKASPAVDEAPSDAELEEEAEQLQREAEALEQQLTQRETADPTVSPSAPTRTTMPTISFDDESMQEAMRQAFTS